MEYAQLQQIQKELLLVQSEKLQLAEQIIQCSNHLLAEESEMPENLNEILEQASQKNPNECMQLSKSQKKLES